jgi:hypothetical protein
VFDFAESSEAEETKMSANFVEDDARLFQPVQLRNWSGLFEGIQPVQLGSTGLMNKLSRFN